MANWNTFRELDAIRREIERALAETEGAGRPGRLAFLPGRSARAYPLVNVSDDANCIYVQALAPGVNPESLDINITRNQLTISGEKTATPGVKPEAYHRCERATARFVRSLDLPSEVNADAITAAYANGILRITLPKAEAAKPRRIAVSVE